MTALAVLSALVVAGIVATFLLVVWVLLHAVVWLVLLPFRLAIALVSWPLALVKGVVGIVVGAILLVVGLVVAFAVAIGVVLAILAPLLPVLLLAAIVWALVRAARRPVVAA